MSKITRKTLRGKRLKPFCKEAIISHNECGPLDQRQFCYGIIVRQTNELLEECENCKANVIHAKCESDENGK